MSDDKELNLFKFIIILSVFLFIGALGWIIYDSNKQKEIYQKEKILYLEALQECVNKLGMEICRDIDYTYCKGWRCDEDDEPLLQKRDMAFGECLKVFDVQKCELIKKWN